MAWFIVDTYKRYLIFSADLLSNILVEINGNNMEEVLDAFDKIRAFDNELPSVIVANTVKGKGVSYMENAVNWHGAAPNDELYEQAINELNAALASMQ